MAVPSTWSSPGPSGAHGVDGLSTWRAQIQLAGSECSVGYERDFGPGSAAHARLVASLASLRDVSSIAHRGFGRSGQQCWVISDEAQELGCVGGIHEGQVSGPVAMASTAGANVAPRSCGCRSARSVLTSSTIAGRRACTARGLRTGRGRVVDSSAGWCRVGGRAW